MISRLTSPLLFTLAFLIASFSLISVLRADESEPVAPVPVVPPSQQPDLGETYPVADSDGNLLRCPADGKVLSIQLGVDTPPAGIGEVEPASPALERRIARRSDFDPSEVEVTETTEAPVPRCGPDGGGSDGEPIWVPESVGQDRLNAPPAYVEEQTP